jgi:hypothetical protein
MAGAAETGATVAVEIATALGLGEAGRFRVRRRNLFMPGAAAPKRWG